MNEGSRHNQPPRTERLSYLDALDRVMAIASFRVDGALCHANANYLRMMGMTYEEAQGRLHSSLCTPALLATSRYHDIWAQLCAGTAYSGVVERVRSDGRSCWMEATYSPVLDAQGQVVEILKIATDITARRTQELAQKAHLQRLSLIADATDTAVIMSDASSRIVHVNGGFSRLFGWHAEEILGQDPIALLSPKLHDGFVQTYRSQLRGGLPVEREEIVVTKTGRRYWVKVVSNPILDDAGQLLFTVSMLTDITRAKMHEALQYRGLEAMARERPLSDVLETICKEVERIAPEITASILEVDAFGMLHPLAGASLPASYSQLLDGLSIGPQAGSCGTAAWRNQAVFVEDIANDPLWTDYKHLALPLGFRACWSTPIQSSEGRAIGTVAFYYRQTCSKAWTEFHQQLADVCVHLCALALEREHARSRIRQLAFYDGLTGLPNRSLLQAQANQAITLAARDKQALAVLFIDLDRFKPVNDSMGHPAGDELLCNVAACLLQALGPSDMAGRLSGDEFVLVLSQTDAEQATSTIERLQEQLANSLVVAGKPLAVSASIGIAMFPEDGRDMDTLLQRADMAMYQAKNAGRGLFSFFSDEMNRLAQERRTLETALRDALKNQELHLHYQPQIELASGQLYGVEALARWTHPALGFISPARFIPLAEECGLIADIGRWALGEACRQLAQWRAQGLRVPSVSVNLSPSSFHDLDLPDMVAQTLQRNALLPQDLTLELTESILLDTNPSTMKTIEAVHAHGVRLSMDDFGTGYSSLSYLRRLPVSELKLDRSFVADLEHNESARALSNAILGIGQSLHLTVVAEGVETLAQRSMLSMQGYPVAQGFLFAHPLAPSELTEWLLQQGQTTTEVEKVGHSSKL